MPSKLVRMLQFVNIPTLINMQKADLFLKGKVT